MPSGAGLLVSLHCTVPVVQLVMPVWHTSMGVHASPSAHETHAPPEQTMLVPQLVPSARLPESAQTGAPVVQSMTPAWHAALGVHAVPATHALHEPLSHTWPVPHGVPLPTFMPVSPHVGIPVVQLSAPV